MTRIVLVAALFAVGCDGGKGGGGGNAQVRQACTKICSCLDEFSSSFSNSGGVSCVDECVNEVTSSNSGPIVSSSSSGGGPSQACLSCINSATCDDLNTNNACSLECGF